MVQIFFRFERFGNDPGDPLRHSRLRTVADHGGEWHGVRILLEQVGDPFLFQPEIIRPAPGDQLSSGLGMGSPDRG